MSTSSRAGLRVWIEGARPKTLGASVAPVLVGTAAAAYAGDVIAWRAAGALVVSVALQVGVNYANDYADGVRGVDRDRRGPVRLTAGGLAAPEAVKAAALGSFAVASVAGTALAVAVDWRLIVVGAACVVAGLLYSGGPRPYASAGLGELFVLVFFGWVATMGSTYVHLGHPTIASFLAGTAVGFGAVAILVVNNLRDIDSDAAAGKRTRAVRWGAPTTRRYYLGCMVSTLGWLLLLAGEVGAWALLPLAAVPVALPAVRTVMRPDATSPQLVAALVATARYQILHGALLALGLWLA